MKRLALFVGLLGAIVGGVASYLDMSDVLATRARHNAFERLATSDVVLQQRKLLQTDPYAAYGGHEVQGARSASPAPPIDLSAGLVPKQSLAGNTKPIAGLPAGAVVTPMPQKHGGGWVVSDSPTPPAGFVPTGTQVDPFAAIAKPVPSYQVNKDGIQTILWTNGYAIESIVTEDGQILHPEPAPSFWQYLLPSIFPVCGFFVPWGLVSAVVWVGAGFVETSK